MLSILTNPALEVTLARIDHDIAETTCTEGCPHCGGNLHSARYPRKPRCVTELSPESNWRLSFCCAAEGCRRRTTPPSVRFLGRRVYPGVLVVLVSTLARGLSATRCRRLKSIFGVDRRTLQRWQSWWREVFPTTMFWHEFRSRVLPLVDETDLPSSLLRRFGPSSLQSVLQLLRSIRPLSVARSKWTRVSLRR